MVTYRITILCS